MENYKVGTGKKRQRLVAANTAALVTLIVMVAMFFGCMPVKHPASYYTEEEHVQRVSERIEEKYIKTGKYDGFELFKLYDEKDKFKYFLVEFEPTGFVYVRINANGGISCGCDPYGMYTLNRSEECFKAFWRRYVVDKNAEPVTMILYDDKEITYHYRKFEVDENGNYLDYTDSHFKVANIKDEKRYFLYIKQSNFTGHIPAVKRGDKYLNLVSMEEFEYVSEVKGDLHSTADGSFSLERDHDL